MDQLQTYYSLVENTIKQLGVDPAKALGKKQGNWSLTKGSVKVWVDVWHLEKEKRSYFQVMSPVVPIPTQNTEAFYKELLEINDKLFGVGFAIYDGWAWIKSIRETEGLDQSEVMSTFQRVGNYADKYDDIFKEKYFGIDAHSQAPSYRGVKAPPGGNHS